MQQAGGGRETMIHPADKVGTGRDFAKRTSSK
jgi:hypothetical protein